MDKKLIAGDNYLVGQKERVDQIQNCSCKQNVVNPIVKIPVAKHDLVIGNGKVVGAGLAKDSRLAARNPPPKPPVQEPGED